MAASAATAQTAASYAGSASAFALKLALGGQGVSAGISSAKAASDGTGAAQGTGGISPAGIVGDVKAANPPGESKPEVCGAVLPPAQLAALPIRIGTGCGIASATGTGASSIASATGKVAELDVTVNTILSGPLAPVTGPIVTTVNSTVSAVCNPLPSPLKEACLAAGNTVNEVVQSVVSTETLSADFGSSTSGVAVSGTTVTTEATASGAIVRILPTPTLQGVSVGQPLATITIARAEAKVVCTLADGKATPSFDPALVRVKLAAPIIALLPSVPDLLPKQTLPGGIGEVDVNISLTNGEFTVNPGTRVVLFAGLPIQTEIVAGSGTATTNPNGTAAATADGVKVHALQLAPAPLAGGLLFDLAHAEAAGGCVAATTVSEPEETPVVTRELPRTGGSPDDLPWLPIAGVAGLGLAVITRRTLRTR
ncbi:MAG TPA: hypothetical protein VM143_06795 [Acidimicrobiales bacterium]|nr:hypothetical protein [Acidimicrobiales bacterium]